MSWLDAGRAACLSLGLALALAASVAWSAETCAPSGPVSLIILQSGQKVRELAASLGGPVLRADSSTVIFADGRVITADVVAAERHLNEVGWGERRIEVLASFPKRRARPRRPSG